MKQTKILFLTYIVASVFAVFSGCVSVSKNADITPQEVYDHIAYLASDSLKGRYPGSEGSRLAAGYIHRQFLDYDLSPLFDNGYQHFKVVTGCSLGKSNYLLINNDSLIIDKDYRPLAFSANAEKMGQVVFAGYGFEIETDSLKWNDYALADVTGKWVLVLREDPEPENMNSEFIPFATDRAKATLAKDKGAIGILLVNGVQASKMDVPLDLTFDQNLSDAGIPVISLTRQAANRIFQGSITIEELEKTILEKQKSVILQSQTTITSNTEVIQNLADAKNLVFMIQAKGNPKTEDAVVVGAHYDHLGMGGKGVSSRMPDTIAAHNGADDNASGVSGIIELAGYYQKQAKKMKKDMIFVAFDAEEMGVLGSKYFVENLPVAKSNIKAMFNYDMIGRMKADSIGISIGGTGTAKEFDSLLHATKPVFATQFSPDGYGPSDHAPFYSAGIPVLFYSTGAHEDYHTPLDDIDKIRPDKEADLLNYSTNIISQVVTTADTLTFQSTGSPQGQQRRSRLKVTLGIIPDMAGIQKNGLGVDGVRKGAPADRGGILKGDKITAINGEPVTNIYDYMFRMSKLKPGTTAVVEVERQNQKVVLLIQL
ncbi:MAG: hypothetical protein A2W84_07485 [Bacteroidetes bacterium GWC2_40_13]|jgi:hypothetical protein|nr:MAG: hypothetical protein A2W84_07485 [Bacteroidetes bacterium GWC2_40_13]